jgi:hypothetical protein
MSFFDELDGTSVVVGLGVGLGIAIIGWSLVPSSTDTDHWKKIRESMKEGAKEGAAEALSNASEKMAKDAAEAASIKVGNAIFEQIENGLLQTVVPQILAIVQASKLQPPNQNPTSQKGGTTS